MKHKMLLIFSILLFSTKVFSLEFLLSKQKLPLELRMVIQAFSKIKTSEDQIQKENEQFLNQLKSINTCWNIDSFASLTLFSKSIIYSDVLEFSPYQNRIQKLMTTKEIEQLSAIRTAEIQKQPLFIIFLLDSFIADLRQQLKDGSETAIKKLQNISPWVSFFQKNKPETFNQYLRPLYLRILDDFSRYCQSLKQINPNSKPSTEDLIIFKHKLSQDEWDKLLKSQEYEHCIKEIAEAAPLEDQAD